MIDIQIVNGLCGDEDPEYLFLEYLQAALQDAILQRLKEAQTVCWKEGTNYFDLVSGIIRGAINVV